MNEKKIERDSNNISGRYILDENGAAVACPDLMTWARWIENRDNCRLKHDEVGNARVSTIFIGLDFNFSGEGSPLLWETRILDSEPHAFYQERYSTRQEALGGHEKAVALVKESFH